MAGAPSVFWCFLWFCWQVRHHAYAARPTARGFEPLRAEPNGFLVHHLNHSVTLSCCVARTNMGAECKYMLFALAGPQGGKGSDHACVWYCDEAVAISFVYGIISGCDVRIRYSLAG